MLGHNKNRNYRMSLSKLHLSDHKLAIEKGRHGGNAKLWKKTMSSLLATN